TFVQEDIKSVIAGGDGEAVEVECGIGVQNSGVVRAQTPDRVIRLQSFVAAENGAAVDGWRVVRDPDVLAVHRDGGCRVGTLLIAGLEFFLVHLGQRSQHAAEQQGAYDDSFHFGTISFSLAEYTTRLPEIGAVAASLRARRNTASNIFSLSLPVEVFCWLGGQEETRIGWA